MSMPRVRLLVWIGCLSVVGALLAGAWFGAALGHRAGMLLNPDLLADATWEIEFYADNGRTACVAATDVVLSRYPLFELEGIARLDAVSNTAALSNSIIVVSVAHGQAPPSPDNTVCLAASAALSNVNICKTIAIPSLSTSLTVCISHNVMDGTVQVNLSLRAVPRWRRALSCAARHRVRVTLTLLGVVAVVLTAWRIRLAPSSPLCPRDPHVRDPWWLHLLGGVLLVVVVASFTCYYHPQRAFVNSDMGWNVLEVAYHRWWRDGLVKWWTDRSGALFIFVPQVLLEWCDLKRYVSHLTALRVQTALCLFIGVAWLGRRTRTFLLLAPVVLIWCVKCRPFAEQPASFGFWIYTVGPAPTLLVMAAFAALMKLVDAPRHWWRWLVVVAACGVAAMIQSPGNIVILGVWYGVLLIIYISYVRRFWKQWLWVGAVLLLVFGATCWLREWYDHAVHQRAQSPLHTEWSAWLPTMRTYLALLWHDNLTELAVVLIGAIIPLPCLLRWWWTRGWLMTRPTRCMPLPEWRAACLLSVSASVYLVLLAANKWVQINPYPIRYLIPALLLYCCAISFCAQVLIDTLRLRTVVCAALCLGLVASYGSLRVRPRVVSEEYRRAQELLRYAPQYGGVVPLIANFWDAYVLSAFDPHHLVASTFDGDPLSEIMLDKVLAHPRIMVKFSGAHGQQWLVSNTPPRALLQRTTLLLRDNDIPALALQGWHAYRVAPWHVYLQFMMNGAPNIIRTNGPPHPGVTTPQD